MKKILFLTGTRADFGKLKPLMREVVQDSNFELDIFVTGMHTMARYGYTVDEVRKAGFKDFHIFMNQIPGEPMELILSNTIAGLSRYVHESTPDMIVIHGDRIEALAGAVVGAIRNILTVHIEGGELSGTIDGLIRHSVTKMSHLHFVANSDASDRLQQLGERPESVFVIGSPDVDVMLSSSLPSMEEVRRYYEISYDKYAIVGLHPVTTNVEETAGAPEFVDALMESGRNYVVIYPNNDAGADQIFAAYKKLEGRPQFKLFSSLRFEYFLTLLQNADSIIGNSSAGIREAPVYGVPSIDVGTRQSGRFHSPSITHVEMRKESIKNAIESVSQMPRFKPCLHFGEGQSARKFMEALRSLALWDTPRHKTFYDISVAG